MGEGLRDLAFTLCEVDETPFLYRGRYYYVPRWEYISVTRSLLSLPSSDLEAMRRCRLYCQDIIWRITFAASAKTKPLSKEEVELLQDILGDGRWASGVVVMA